MSLFVPQGPDFQWYYSNTSTIRPTGQFGTSITPGTTAGSYGAWAQVATSGNIAQEVYGVYINFNSGASSGAVRNILCEMGVDNAGGTSYVSVIPYLMAGGAMIHSTAPGGIYYYFPLYIKAGSSIAFRAMSNSSTALRVNVYFYGQPRRPDAVRAGSYVDAFGVNVNSRIGTSITPGTSSEGSYQQLGSATTRNYWWWQAGLGINNATINAATMHLDLFAGSSSTVGKTLFENQVWFTDTSEQIASTPIFQNAYNNIAPGENIYGRTIQSGTATTGTTLIAYGLGG